AWEDLRDATLLMKLDPQYDDLARHVGRALAILSGRCPDATGIGPQPESCPAGEPVERGYDGLAPSLRSVAEGLSRAEPGIARILDGLDRIDAGLARLESGLTSGRPNLERLETGVGRMIAGLDRAVPGLTRLRRGLETGVSLVEEIGSDLIPEPGDEVALTASIVEAFPKLRRQLSLFVGEQGRATRMFVALSRPPYDARAPQTSRRIEEIAPLSLRETALEDADVFVAGTPTFFSDVADSSESSFNTIVWVVVLGIFLILVLLLRSVVSPLYLVATVVLSFASTLGLTVIVFQGLLGDAGVTWWLPAFLFVILVALGADYNIFLMGRIREEAASQPTRPAVADGLAATGRVITSAGMILAGTFAALLVSPLEGLVQFGFATTVGLLIDTFIVRSLLVPSIAVLMGSASWWPSRRAARA
ncbi:MAG TPA: MMPL family transporter, partial [Actinomycetota bacterium]|nr:MMPL family transporter [Actinomycetota bacterium]